MEKLYRWVLRLGGGPYKYIAHYNLGRWLQEEGKYEEAAKHYRRAIELKPDHRIAYNNLGNVLCFMGRFEECKAAYFRALEIKDYASPHNNLADLYLRQGRLEKAEEEVLIALRMEPDHATFVRTYAEVLTAQGRLEEAEEQYRHAISIDPNAISSYEELADLLTRQQRSEEAEELRQKAHELEMAKEFRCEGLREWSERSQAYSKRKKRQSEGSQ